MIAMDVKRQLKIPEDQWSCKTLTWYLGQAQNKVWFKMAQSFLRIGFRSQAAKVLKNQQFSLFPIDKPVTKFWPCCKIGQGQPTVIIWTNYDGQESPMRHTNFRWKSVHQFRSGRFLKGFYHIWAWRPSWWCDHHRVKKFSFPSSESLHIKFGFD